MGDNSPNLVTLVATLGSLEPTNLPKQRSLLFFSLGKPLDSEIRVRSQKQFSRKML
jgi:hypothetical protein